VSAGKSSAVVGLAAQLGTGEAHTPRDGQLDLLAADLDAELAGLGEVAGGVPAKRGPGRPPGSPNRTTRQMAGLLRARGYRDPWEFLAALVSTPTGDLRRAIGSEDADKVLEVQRKAAAELMKYTYSPMPVAVEHTGEGGRPVVAVMLGGAGQGDAAKVVDGLSLPIVQYQGVSGAQGGASHDAASHDPAISEQNQHDDDD
jgi:hypothetical protein